MKFLDTLLSSLPSITSCDMGNLPQNAIYVGVAGFEDRSLSILKEIQNKPRTFSAALAIQYQPFDEQNRLSEFKSLLRGAGVSDANQLWITYDRYDPESFEEAFLNAAVDFLTPRNLVVDISGMSKLLITVLLENLAKCSLNLDIVYAEAAKYHPTRERFEASKLSFTEESPDFLTTDVYKNVTTKSLSSVSMQGYPIAMIGFPTFNKKDLMSILNELTPQRLIIVEGQPHESENDWRIDAVRQINKSLTDYIKPERFLASTFDYKETVSCLEDIYEKYGRDHKVILAPTGSKLQTIGAFLFRQLHPDVQIIYPVTKRHELKYTDGYKALWRLSFGEMREFSSKLKSFRFRGLDELARIIAECGKKAE